MPSPYFQPLCFDALPGTKITIAAAAGVSRFVVDAFIIKNHTNDPLTRKVHISGWRRSVKGPARPVYAEGSGKDVACRIVCLTDRQKAFRYRAHIKALGMWEESIAKQRARYWANKARTRGSSDLLMTAFFGRRPAVALSNRQ